MNRSLLRVAGTVAVSVAALLALPAMSASAHSQLDSSTPAANSVVEASPPSIVLDFSEEIEGSLADIRLFDSKGTLVPVGPPERGENPSIVTVKVPTLAKGLYAVIWRVTSADGHPVDGAFSFQFGAEAAGSGKALIDQVRNGNSSATAVSWTYGVMRFLALAGAIMLLGAGFWSQQGRPPLGEHPSVHRLMRASWLTLFVGSLGAFAMFGSQATAGGLASGLKPSVWRTIVGTQTGNMLLARILLTFVLAALVARPQPNVLWKASAAIASLGLLITFSGAGHPNALTPRGLWILIDVTHLAAIAVWLGGLVTLWRVGQEWIAEPEALHPTKMFSLASTIAVPVIVGTGVLQTWKLAGGLSDVTATDWGRLLLGKVMLVVVILAIAAVSRWLLINEGASSIRRTVIAEAVVGLLVVGLAAGMVAQPPRPAIPHREFSQTLTASGLIATVSVSPGQVGRNDFHLIITPPGGSIAPVSGATVRVSLPSANVPNSPVNLLVEGPNHYSGKLTIPKPGDWVLEVLVKVTPTSTVLIKTNFTIP